MYCIVGLGNPGDTYRYTRHNIGFMTVDALSRRLNAEFKDGCGPYQISEIHRHGHDLLLIRPMTYMNRSGIAVDDAVKRYSLNIDRCLIVLDDVQLPFKSLRLRPKGSDGGHNGLASVINFLRTSNIARLRIGIGMDPDEDLISYVLSPFCKEEKKALDSIIEKSTDVLLGYLNHGITETMNKYNS